jgi:hypothetical protein
MPRPPEIDAIITEIQTKKEKIPIDTEKMKTILPEEFLSLPWHQRLELITN